MSLAARSVALCSLWPPLQRITAACWNIIRFRVMTPVQQNAECLLYTWRPYCSIPCNNISERTQNEVTGRRYAVTVKVLTELLLSQMYVCCLQNPQCKCFSGSSHTKTNKAQHAMCQQQAVKFNFCFRFFFFFFLNISHNLLDSKCTS